MEINTMLTTKDETCSRKAEELRIIRNSEYGEIRTVTVDGKIFFVASDVAKALGYTNPSKAINDHCRWVTKRYIPHPQSKGKAIEVNVIPEGDIYRLVANSQLPNAEKFESWIFDEILPSIRQNGGYIANQENLTPEQIVANALIVAQNIILQKDRQIEEMQPKADYFDELIDRNLLTSFRETAKELGIKESVFINWLIGKNYVYRDNKNKLQPYSTAMSKGLFEVKEYSSKYSNHAGTQTLITPKGRETFRLLIKL